MSLRALLTALLPSDHAMVINAAAGPPPGTPRQPTRRCHPDHISPCYRNCDLCIGYEDPDCAVCVNEGGCSHRG